MNKVFGVLMLVLSVSAFAGAPPVYFNPTSVGLSTSSFNSGGYGSYTVGGITVNAYTYYNGAYTPSHLWLRNEAPADRGFGVCSTGEACGLPGATGNGDYNELSNEGTLNHHPREEVIRLTLPTNMQWSDLFVSSLDTGGSNNNESGLLYWSNSPTPNLSSLSDAPFSHNTLGADYGSIWNLVSGSINPNDRYLFFTPDASNGTNNDYLVWGAAVSSVPEPRTYAMWLAGLGLLGFMSRRREILDV